MILLWVVVVIGGLGLAVFSSGTTLDSATTLARHLGLSPFIIGMTVVAIGTDLPEIANSITASASGHGDINVGDSIGSTVTQITLVLGLLCLIRPIKADRRLIGIAGSMTVLAVLVGAALLADDHLGRLDGSILLLVWFVGTMVVQRTGHVVIGLQETLFSRNMAVTIRNLLVGLAGIAVGATLAVQGFIQIADRLGVPEYATSFIVLALGTSIPELVVDGRALRRGENALAMGDIVGSSFVDATLSLGIGPLLFPTVVSASALTGSLIAAVVVSLALVILLSRRVHGRRSAAMLMALYLSTYLVLLA